MRKNKKNFGFTLLEMMIVVALLVVMMAAGYGILASGQSSWFTTDANIELQENLRRTLGRVRRELRESGFDKNSADQVLITDGGGVNNTDIIRFSIPVLCQAGNTVLDNAGDIAYWGAPLTWGCTSSACMDADDDCSTVDYKFIEYRLDANNQLLRRVLDAAVPANQVRQDILAQDITDFQITRSVDNNVITLQVTVQKTSNLSRVLNASVSVDIYLRNRG